MSNDEGIIKMVKLQIFMDDKGSTAHYSSIEFSFLKTIQVYISNFRDS